MLNLPRLDNFKQKRNDLDYYWYYYYYYLIKGE